MIINDALHSGKLHVQQMQRVIVIKRIVVSQVNRMPTVWSLLTDKFFDITWLSSLYI